MTLAEMALTAVACAALGVTIGTVTGLVPGLHVNTVAPLLLVATATVGGATLGPAAALLVLAVAAVHTVVNIIPTLAAPIPDDTTALILLPVQRMAREGRAGDALQLSVRTAALAGASTITIAAALLLMLPWLPPLPDAVAASIVTLVVILLVTRHKRPGRAFAVLCLSGFAGILLLPVSAHGFLGGDGSVLLPAFAGFFGAPLLLHALFEPPAAASGAGAATLAAGVDGRRTDRFLPWVGTACGLLVAVLPGLTGATGGALGRAVRRPRSDDEDVTLLSAIDTANGVGNVAGLVLWGQLRSGASVAAASAWPMAAGAGAGETAALVLGTVLLALCAGAWIALVLGGRLVLFVRGLPARPLAGAGLAMLVVLVFFHGGAWGLAITVLLLPLGLLPHAWDVPRALLMGFLLVPYLGSVHGLW